MPIRPQYPTQSELHKTSLKTAAPLLPPFRDQPWFWGEEWRMGVVPCSLTEFLDEPNRLQEAHWLDLPWTGGYGCDPWLVHHNGDHLVFFEFYDKQLGRGGIACGALQHNQGRWDLENVRQVLKEPHHLSHPCVFCYKGRWFLLPEAADSGDITLYEAIEFPDRWRKLDAILPGVPGLDPTFFEHENQCWISCSLKSDSHDGELHLFHAKDPTGPWTSHPHNPVKSTANGSRPAGPVLFEHGKIIRPGQDSRFTYGHRVVLHEIHSLTTGHFQESPVAVIEAPSHSVAINGLHSLSTDEKFCLIDAKRYIGLKALLGPLLFFWRQWRTGDRSAP